MVIPAELVTSLSNARRITFLTGAGISADSGLPTFRDKQTGLWGRFDPLKLATPQAFERDPALVWGWYEWRRMKVMRAVPNNAHLALKIIEQKSTLTLVTQNVDDLHERAGSSRVIHLHGTLFDPICTVCRQVHVLPPGFPDEPEGGRRVEPPRCIYCGSLVRPGVVWFGEMLPQDAWNAAEQAALACDLFACVGSSSLVYPAASLSKLARDAGATTLQINPSTADSSPEFSHTLRGMAESVLPELVMQTWPETQPQTNKGRAS
jgi:NAD-dependent deacetylase